MNFEKIGQFIGVALLFAGGSSFYKLDIPLQTSVIIIAILSPIAIFFIWAGISLEENKQRKINIARYEKEDEEFNKELKANPIPSSMMQIIYNFSLAKPKSRKQGVKIITNFLIEEITKPLGETNTKSDKDNLIDKGYFFFSIHQFLSDKFKSGDKYGPTFFKAFLKKESSALNPTDFMSTIQDVKVDLETLHKFSAYLESFIDKATDTSIVHIGGFYRSFERESND